ncbi:hypothetical protein [Vagococcus sp. CY53-2]|uniref:hypothetical protein n=1 Tax=Vagococcus sp. CY53-2 TaxID=2925780 RepID=UPI001F505584|nr:hypothetical protein [Vagococcus sp. CY53-2]MCI0131224.1 hypothetical protein [Vagococcus sp. CY53-2]
MTNPKNALSNIPTDILYQMGMPIKQTFISNETMNEFNKQLGSKVITQTTAVINESLDTTTGSSSSTTPNDTTKK